MAADSSVGKVLLIAVSALTGVTLTGAGMVIRGDALGREAARETETRVMEQIERNKTAQDWTNQMILQELREIRGVLTKP